MKTKPTVKIDMKRWLSGSFGSIWIGMLLIAVCPAQALAFNNGADNFALVVTDSFGRPMAGKQVELLVELTTGSLDGQAQYAETQAVASDSEGVVRFPLGFGKPTDPKFVFDNFDVAQGNNFLTLSVKEAGSWRMLLRSQIPNVPEVRKWLFANEKSNTVVAIMIVVWVGIVVYLLLSGRKMRKLEKQLEELKQRRG